MIRCIIVDDEKPARDELTYLLSSIEDIMVVGEAENGIQAIRKAIEEKPQLVFLDVNMPGINGIDVAKELAALESKPLIVFITAYDSYAVSAFEVSAFDYLLKPVSEERLRNSLDRIRSMVSSREARVLDKLDKLSGELGLSRSTRIVGYQNGMLFPIELDEILFLTLEEKNTIVVCERGKFQINGTLSELQEKLSDRRFFRSHKSYIVNLDRIDSIEPWFNSTYNIHIKGIDETIPVSRTYAKAFKEAMNILM
jgi:two-component system LytT family response regulator/two-component system response regulator LytT